MTKYSRRNKVEHPRKIKTIGETLSVPGISKGRSMIANIAPPKLKQDKKSIDILRKSRNVPVDSSSYLRLSVPLFIKKIIAQLL